MESSFKILTLNRTIIQLQQVVLRVLRDLRGYILQRYEMCLCYQRVTLLLAFFWSFSTITSFTPSCFFFSVTI